jgi:hypothetical protein
MLRQFLNYWARTPNNYFDSQQAPLIRVKIPKEIETLAEGDLYSVANTTFEDNKFIATKLYQPFIYSQIFKGGLIQYESETMHSGFFFNDNGIEDNYVLGQEASLFYVKGATITAKNNLFLRNGHLNVTLDEVHREQLNHL